MIHTKKLEIGSDHQIPESHKGVYFERTYARGILKTHCPRIVKIIGIWVFHIALITPLIDICIPINPKKSAAIRITPAQISITC